MLGGGSEEKLKLEWSIEKGVLAQREGSHIPQAIRGPWKQQSIHH